jgi:two-component system chemotaxis sensor kinase CheA
MDMSGFLRRYAEESAERVQDIENGIARLETKPRDKALVDHLMRQAHTVKGGARMLRLKSVQDLAHALEDAMAEAGSSRRTITPLLIDAMMASAKGLRTLLAAIRPEHKEPQGPTPVDVDALAAFVREGKPPPGWKGTVPAADPGEAAPAAGEDAPAEGEDGGDRGAADTATTELESALHKVKAGHSVRVAVSRLNELGNLTVEMTVERAKARARHRRLEAFGFSIARARTSTGGMVRENDPLEAAFRDLETVHRRLVDESEDEQARRAGLDEELRAHVQALRLTPLRVVFDAFPASVREIARGLGKEVDLAITGAETELDRRIVDEVGEPLVHLVRNSLDHGIESPADREKAGKPRRGKLAIKAWAAEGAIFVEVRDDGRGIDPDRLRAAAASRGVLTKEEAARLTDAQALEMIFLPGFSTRERVSEISGRGVGMDSVRVAIGRLGGSVGVDSIPGEGTRVLCRLPLTLALVRVLLFRVGPEILAVELRAALWAGSFATAATLNYEEEEDEQPLPVVSMAETLGFEDLGPSAEEEPPSFLILRSAGTRAIFVVDEVLEDAEVALKEAPAYVRRSRLVAGVTLLGSGEPAVVVEPSELLARALTRRAQPVGEGAGGNGNGTG